MGPRGERQAASAANEEAQAETSEETRARNTSITTEGAYELTQDDFAEEQVFEDGEAEEGAEGESRPAEPWLWGLRYRIEGDFALELGALFRGRSFEQARELFPLGDDAVGLVDAPACDEKHQCDDSRLHGPSEQGEHRTHPAEPGTRQAEELGVSETHTGAPAQLSVHEVER